MITKHNFFCPCAQDVTVTSDSSFNAAYTYNKQNIGVPAAISRAYFSAMQKKTFRLNPTLMSCFTYV
jgi:hypothetical protein